MKTDRLTFDESSEILCFDLMLEHMTDCLTCSTATQTEQLCDAGLGLQNDWEDASEALTGASRSI